MKKIFLLTPLLLAGCATTWHSDKFANEQLKEAQLKKDTGYCKGISYGAVPMPAIRVYNPQQQSYNIQGTATGFNSETGYTNYRYSGTATPYAGGFAGGFASGVANGIAIGEAIRAENARKAIFDACMMNLGWSDSPITQKSEQPKQSTSQQSQSNQEKPETQGGEWEEVACHLYKDYITPGEFDDKYISLFVLNKKRKMIESIPKRNVKLRAWDDERIVLTQSTDVRFNTTPPISKHLMESITLKDSKYMLAVAWTTDDGAPLNSADLKRIAGNHPMWQKKDGIVSWWLAGSCTPNEKK